MSASPAGSTLEPRRAVSSPTSGAAVGPSLARGVAGRVRAASGASGVLLCGGRSRRMGFDKARLELGGSTLLQRAAAQLELVCDELLVASGGERRYGDLLDRAPTRRWVLDAADAGDAPAGPLAGLAAALGAARSEWVVAAACDMPALDAEVFLALLERARAADLDVCLAAVRDAASGSLRAQPLLGVYRRRVLPAIELALRLGQRRLVDFHALALPSGELPRVGTLELSDAPEHHRRAVTNLNDPNDVTGFGLACPVPDAVRPR